MAKISQIVVETEHHNALKIGVTLDTRKTYATTIYPTVTPGNQHKAIAVVQRIVQPHLTDLLLKHISHLDNLLAGVLETAEGHTGNYNLSFAFSLLLWQAYLDQPAAESLGELIPFAAERSEKLPAYIFSLPTHETEAPGYFAEFSLIPRRNLEFEQAQKMYKKVRENLHQLPHGNNSDRLEQIQSAIKESALVFNHDIFIEIRPELRATDNYNYAVADCTENLDSHALIDYFKKIVQLYQPLLIENPLAEYDEPLYAILEQEVAQEALIGYAYHPSARADLLVKRLLKNRKISLLGVDSRSLRSVSQMIELLQLSHEQKIKVAVTHDRKSSILQSIIDEVRPEFIHDQTI